MKFLIILKKILVLLVPYESPAGGLESGKKIPEEHQRFFPGDNKEKERKQAIRRFEDEIEP